MILTKYELINYIDAIREVIVFKAADIKSYKYINIMHIYHSDKIKKYESFVDEFEKNYQDYAF